MVTMTSVALDVHARSTQATSVDMVTGEVARARLSGDTDELVGFLLGLAQPVRACYEAGPTGFGLARAARAAGIVLEVIAPSKTPRKRGERIKTDRRDADHLVRQLIAGALTPIRIPSADEEAARDVLRDREQVRGDLLRARHRLSKFLLRNGRVWPAEKSAWTQRHRAWLDRQRFSEIDLELVYTDLVATVDALCDRRERLDRALDAVARRDAYWPTVSRLRAFRGIDTISALGIHLEVGDWTRFAKAKDVGAYFGLVPSLDQSGEGSTSGQITKTGSRYARRLLVEAAWHNAHPPRVGIVLRRRQEGIADPVRQISWACQRRLHHLSRRFDERRVNGNKANIARARELACFLWAAATWEP
jgi:transposase